MPMPMPHRPRRSSASSMHLGVIVGLAMRNLRRHLRRTALTSSAMIVGGALLIFSFSLGDGTHETWIDSGVRMGTGHVTVERPEYQRSRKLEDRLSAEVRAAAERALESADLAPHIIAASSKLAVNALASSAAGARPAQVMAVDPVAEMGFSTLDDQLVEGRYLEPDDRLAAYVGVGLVESLDLRLGSRMVVQAQDADGEVAAQLLRVVGIFRSGVPGIDQALMHIPLATGGEWLGSGHDVTNVGLVVADSAVVARVAGALERELAEPVRRGEVRVMGWRESNPALNAAITIDDFGNYLVYGILFTIIAFGIVNTILMSVLHRRREFGLLQALGLTPGQTGAVVLVEGLTMTAVSGLLGVGLGLALTWYFVGDGLDFSQLISEEMTFSGVVIDPVIIPLFRVSRLLQALTLLLFIGTVASIYPALRAARIDVTEAMKFER